MLIYLSFSWILLGQASSHTNIWLSDYLCVIGYLYSGGTWSRLSTRRLPTHPPTHLWASHCIVPQHHVIQDMSTKEDSSKASGPQKPSLLKKARVVTWECWGHHKVCFSDGQTWMPCIICIALLPHSIFLLWMLVINPFPLKYQSSQRFIPRFVGHRCRWSPFGCWNLASQHW